MRKKENFPVLSFACVNCSDSTLSASVATNSWVSHPCAHSSDFRSFLAFFMLSITKEEAGNIYI